MVSNFQTGLLGSRISARGSEPEAPFSVPGPAGIRFEVPICYVWSLELEAY